jgi:hypothetical protein
VLIGELDLGVSKLDLEFGDVQPSGSSVPIKVIREKVVRLAQKMQVVPCIPLGIQL